MALSMLEAVTHVEGHDAAADAHHEHEGTEYQAA